jgi:dienelactone hydrolase
LIGEKDDWTPASECKFHLKPKEGWPEIILKVYPDAYHAFDATHGIGFYMGHVTGRNQSAAEDSYKMVKAFLIKYLVD